MDFIEFLRMMRRRWRWIVALGVAGGIAGAAIGYLAGDRNTTITGRGRYFEATTTVAVTSTSPVSRGTTTLNLDQVAFFATTGEVPTLVAGDLGLERREVLERITTEADPTTGTLAITAIDRDSDDAATLADTTASRLTTYVLESAEKDYQEQLAASNRRIDDLRRRLDELQAQQPAPTARLGEVEAWRAQLSVLGAQLGRAYSSLTDLAERAEQPIPIRAIDQADALPIDGNTYDRLLAQARSGDANSRAGELQQPDDETVSSGGQVPGPLSAGILGTVLGLVLGTGVALGVDRIDRRLQNREEIEHAYGLPVLAEIPALSRNEQKDRQVASAANPMSFTAEAYRSVRSMLQFAQPKDPDHTDPRRRAFVVLVASAHPREGKTTVTANLAAVFAEAGGRVLALNCDSRRPTLHMHFGVEDVAGAVLATPVDGVALVSNLVVTPEAGPAQVVEAQQQLLDRARAVFDVVVVDTAPVLTTNDAINLVGLADAVVLVTRIGMTTVDAARRVTELLTRVGAPAAGVVATGAPRPTTGYYSYYYAHQRPSGRAPAAPSSDELQIPTPGASRSVTETDLDEHETVSSEDGGNRTF